MVFENLHVANPNRVGGPQFDAADDPVPVPLRVFGDRVRQVPIGILYVLSMQTVSVYRPGDSAPRSYRCGADRLFCVPTDLPSIQTFDSQWQRSSNSSIRLPAHFCGTSKSR